MTPGVLLPLLLAALIGFVVLAFVLRARGALHEARRAERFRARMVDQARRAEATFVPLVEAADAVRRGGGDPAVIEQMAAAARGQLAGLADETRGLAAPPGRSGERDRLAEELERGARAAELVLGGCRLLLTRDAARGAVEAHTSIKRGYLNLVHAREAVAEAAQTTRPRRAPAT